MFYKFINKSKLALTIFLAVFLQMAEIQAQIQPTSFWSSNWVVGVSPGVASYYGDLSRYDFNPVDKVFHESGPAVSLIAGKKLKNILEFGFVASFGKTSAESDSSNLGYGFKNKYKEYGVYTALSIANIILPDRNFRFDYGLMANYNFMQWRSVSYPIVYPGAEPAIGNVITENGLDVNGKNKGNGETSHHFGAGYYLAYRLNSHFTIRLSQTMKLLNTDEFDSFIGPTNTKIDDRLLLSEIGLIFRISQLWSPINDYEEIPVFR